MKHSLLGIDLKVIPDTLRTGSEPWYQAKILDVNGWNTGLTVLDRAGFDRFIAALSPDSGKTFLMRYQTPGDMRPAWIKAFTDNVDFVEEVRYPFAQITEWIHDLPTIYTERRSKQLNAIKLDIDKNCEAVAAAARRKGLETVIAPQCSFARHGVRLDPSTSEARFDNINAMRAAKFDPEPKLYAWEELAFVMGVNPGTVEKFTEDTTLYFNSSFEETILDNKGLLYELDTLFPELGIGLRKYQPSTTMWGCGLTNKTQFQKWLDQETATLFVRKPLAGTQGVGIRFLSKAELVRDLEPHVKNENASAAYLNLLVDLMMGDANIENRAAIIQEFVPSVPIPLEGKVFDGCARAIVVSGSCVGNQWRCGIAPVDSHESPTKKFRASLSCGSRTAEMSAEHQEIAAAVSEAFAAEFSASCTRLQEKLASESFAIFDNTIGPSEQLRVLFFLKRLKQSARGHLDLAGTIKTTLPKCLGEQLLEVFASI